MPGAKLKYFVTVTLLFLMLQPVWSAGFSYRYRDNTGITHIGYSIPPQFVENGYEMLNDQGRVVEVVLPKKALDERSKELLREAEIRHQTEMQRSKDEALLRFYSSIEDVERVRERKLLEFDNFMNIQEANILSYKKKVANLQAQAAELERTNRDIPKEILDTLKTLEEKISDAEQAIELKKKEKEQVRQAFEQDIKRLGYLLFGDEPIATQSAKSK